MKYPNSFTARYNLHLLVYFESYSTIEEAISMEKFIKGKSRKWKEDLINQQNPELNSLKTLLILQLSLMAHL
jgi:putative endonuclease